MSSTSATPTQRLHTYFSALPLGSMGPWQEQARLYWQSAGLSGIQHDPKNPLLSRLASLLHTPQQPPATCPSLAYPPPAWASTLCLSQHTLPQKHPYWQLHAHQSLPLLAGLSTLQQHISPWAALNASMLHSLYTLELIRQAEPSYVFVQLPLAGNLCHTRLLVRAQAHTTAHVILAYPCTAPTLWANHVVDVELRQGAQLCLYVLPLQGAQAQLHTLYVQQAEDSSFRSCTLATNAPVSHYEAYIHLQAPRAQAHIGGLNIGTGQQHTSHRIALEHQSIQGKSYTHYRNIVEGKSCVNLTAQVHVAPGTSDNIAHQSLRTLLVSPRAQAYVRPQLEIHNQELVCTHGATLGGLDQEALYYLKSRGIGTQRAQSLLLEAFSQAVLADIAQPDVRAYMHQLASQLLDRKLAYP